MNIDVPIKIAMRGYPIFLFILNIIIKGQDKIVSSSSAYKRANQGRQI